MKYNYLLILLCIGYKFSFAAHFHEYDDPHAFENCYKYKNYFTELFFYLKQAYGNTKLILLEKDSMIYTYAFLTEPKPNLVELKLWNYFNEHWGYALMHLVKTKLKPGQIFFWQQGQIIMPPEHQPTHTPFCFKTCPLSLYIAFQTPRGGILDTHFNHFLIHSNK